MRVVSVAQVATALGCAVKAGRSSWQIAPCPACGAERRAGAKKRGDKRGAVGSSRENPRGWKCQACEQTGDALHFVALHLTGRRMGGLNDSERAEVRRWCEDFLGSPVGREPPPEPEELPYIPEDELEDFWSRCVPVVDDPEVRAFLERRRVDPALVAERDLARALPKGLRRLPQWARFASGRPWTEHGNRLIVPAFDHHGARRSVIGRNVRKPKSVGPTERNRKGLVLACPLGRHLLEHGAVPPTLGERPRVVLGEGEVDFLAWATEPYRGERYASWGIFSGSLRPELFDRLPTGMTVVCATDADPPGDRYAEKVTHLLAERLRGPAFWLERWRPPTIGSDPLQDAGDVRLAQLPLEPRGELVEAPDELPDPPPRKESPEPPPPLDAPFPEYDLDSGGWDALPAGARAADQPDWSALLKRTHRGTIRKSLGNLLVVLQHDARFHGVLGFDERDGQVQLLAPPPYLAMAELEAGDYPRQVTDADEVWICRWLEVQYGLDWPIEKIHGAVNAIAGRNSFDPVLEHLEQLDWDGVARADTWLVDYLGAVDTPLTRAVGACWLISAVARAFLPGCKVDHALVLEAKQGARKSTALAIMAGREEWFCDKLPDVRRGKDAAEILQGPWIVELAELDALGKAEAATIKAFLTSQADRYRPAYGRRTITRPRRCVFAASTNEQAYLKDPTGGRRFWPVKVTETGPIDLKGLRKARDQIWAEAVHRFHQGEPWHLVGRELNEAAREAQEDRYQGDEWEAVIRTYLEKEQLGLVQPRVTIGDCLAVIGLRKEDYDKQSQMRVSTILGRLGWERKRKRDGTNGRARWAYEMIPTSEGGWDHDGEKWGYEASDGDRAHSGQDVAALSPSPGEGENGDRGPMIPTPPANDPNHQMVVGITNRGKNPTKMGGDPNDPNDPNLIKTPGEYDGDGGELGIGGAIPTRVSPRTRGVLKERLGSQEGLGSSHPEDATFHPDDPRQFEDEW
ncbi:MAG: virulence-associated E family protein [Sandaracinaceae bacterium]